MSDTENEEILVDSTKLRSDVSDCDVYKLL